MIGRAARVSGLRHRTVGRPVCTPAIVPRNAWRSFARAVVGDRPLRDSGSKLQIQIASDLHVEFYRDDPPFDDLIVPAAPYLALLGDIGLVARPNYQRFLEKASSMFDKVLFLAGNHEFYNPEWLPNWNRTNNSSVEAMKAAMREMQSDRLVFLDDSSLLLDGVRILGSTLWSHVPPPAVPNVQRLLNDYRVIYQRDVDGGLTNITVHDTNEWHRAHVAFLDRELQKAKDADERCLVLTHHAPFMLGTSAPEFDDSPQRSAFSTNLSRLFKEGSSRYPVDVWVSGHTHFNYDHVRLGTRLVANQRGYPGRPLTSYRRDLVIEV